MQATTEFPTSASFVPGSGLPKVLLIDDHHLLLDALSFVLAPQFETFTVNSLAKLEPAVTSFNPDVVIFDIGMPDGDGITAARGLMRSHPGLKLIFLSMYSEGSYVRRANEAGAQAFVTKSATAEELCRAIRTVLDGGHYLSPSLAALPDSGSQQDTNLTDRQKQVLHLIARGYSAKEIATDLNISVRTAEFHRAAIMDRLKLHSTAMMTRYAVAQGIA